MNLVLLDEPELEFGAGRHFDIRFGIMNKGPLDFESALAPKRINIGIVGTSETIEGLREWLERCRREIPAKQSKQPNLFPRFPGFNPDQAFMSTLVLDDKMCREIRPREITTAASIKNMDERIQKFVEVFLDGIRYLQQSSPAKVIVCAVPLMMLEAMQDVFDDETSSEPESGEDITRLGRPDFHDLLKARSMQFASYADPDRFALNLGCFVIRKAEQNWYAQKTARRSDTRLELSHRPILQSRG